jgi:isocitrate/isopropylmalate dehydrogenase
MKHDTSVEDMSPGDGEQFPDIALCKDQKPGRVAEACDVTCDEKTADAACAELVSCPQAFDVIVTTDPFGDIFYNHFAAPGGGLGIERRANA